MKAFSLATAILLAAVPAASAAITVNVNGTVEAPFIHVTVDNADVFTGAPFNVITFHLPPNDSGITVVLDGPLGDANPVILRGPVDGSYLNLFRLSAGDFSAITLSAANPYTSSTILSQGDITALAALDGVTTVMNLIDGTGPATTPVTVRYNLVPEPASAILSTLAATASLGTRRRRRAV